MKSVEHSNQILEEKWKNKELVFGFGHSFYHLKNPDPRVVLTQVYHDELAKKKPFGNPERIEITRNIQKRMVNEKKIAPNCDFSNSVTYDQLGFPM